MQNNSLPYSGSRKQIILIVIVEKIQSIANMTFLIDKKAEHCNHYYVYFFSYGNTKRSILFCTAVGILGKNFV